MIFLFLMACELPQNDGVACKFEQKKKSPLFRKEITSAGQLWVRGGKLRFDNNGGTLIVAGSDVTMKSAGKTEKLSLAQAPKIEAFLGTFSGLFEGKVDKQLDSKCADDRWELTPKGEAPVKRVVLTFRSNALQRIELTENSGDEIALTLSQCKFGAEAVPDSVFQ